MSLAASGLHCALSPCRLPGWGRGAVRMPRPAARAHWAALLSVRKGEGEGMWGREGNGRGEGLRASLERALLIHVKQTPARLGRVLSCIDELICASPHLLPLVIGAVLAAENVGPIFPSPLFPLPLPLRCSDDYCCWPRWWQLPNCRVSEGVQSAGRERLSSPPSAPHKPKPLCSLLLTPHSSALPLSLPSHPSRPVQAVSG